MNETGHVRSVSDGRAEVEVEAQGGCEHCGARGVCNWTGTRVRRVMAVNRAGAKAGDRVVLEPAERSRAWSNLLVFGVPACLMLAGVLVGGLVMRRDLWAGVLSGAGLVVGWLIVKLVDRSVSRSGRVLPVIVRLADSTEDKGDDDEMVDRDAGCGDGR